ncbi:MAG: cytochrome ubiquinol oxidase subunit II [Gammaproteobacteria bacterium]
MLLLLSGCTSSAQDLSFLDPQGPVAAAQRTHLIGIVAIVLIVVLPVIVLAPLYAWRYRYRNSSAPYTPRWAFSRPLEFVIWGVPFAIVIGLAVWLSKSTLALDPYKPRSPDTPLHIQVIGYDWKWLFIYPRSGVASMGLLAFPAGRPLSLDLTSDTVMQSFFIPALGSQIYAMGGMVTHLHLAADAPGRFLGENTQYNGKGFAQQKFIARAMTPADYHAWIRHVRTTGIRLTPGVYDVLRKRATKTAARKALHADRMPDGEVYFTGVSPQLFGNVVRSFHGGPSTSAALVRGMASGYGSKSGAGPARATAAE